MDTFCSTGGAPTLCPEVRFCCSCCSTLVLCNCMSERTRSILWNISELGCIHDRSQDGLLTHVIIAFTELPSSGLGGPNVAMSEYVSFW